MQTSTCFRTPLLFLTPTEAPFARKSPKPRKSLCSFTHRTTRRWGCGWYAGWLYIVVVSCLQFRGLLGACVDVVFLHVAITTQANCCELSTSHVPQHQLRYQKPGMVENSFHQGLTPAIREASKNLSTPFGYHRSIVKGQNRIHVVVSAKQRDARRRQRDERANRACVQYV